MYHVLAVRQALGTSTFLATLATLFLIVGLLAFAARHRDSLAGAWFARWLAADCVWIGAHATGLLLFDPQLRVLSDAVELAAIPVAATCWVFFTLAYSGRWTGERYGLLVVLPVATTVLSLVVLTTPLHGLVHDVATTEVVAGVSVVDDGVTTDAIWLLLAYVFSQYLAGLAVLLDLVASTDRLYRDQVVALVVAIAVPLGVAAGTMLELLTVVVDPTPTSFGLSAVPLTYAVFRSELLDLVPASYRVGEQTALETLDQGVLVRDADDRVVFANASAASILAVDRGDLLGRSVRTVLATSHLEPGSSWTGDAGVTPDDDGSSGSRDVERTDGGGATASSGENRLPETLRDVDSGRTYRLHASAADDADAATGSTLFLEDVTEERRRKQRLLVLNRIVRHNLRNDMNVLRGHVDLLAERVDDESVAVADAIATDLLHLGEKAHEMDRIIRESVVDAEPVNVPAVVDRVARQMESETGATVEVWGDVQAWTRTQTELVEAIVRNLVEIAVRRREPDGSTARSAVEARAGASAAGSPPAADASPAGAADSRVDGAGAAAGAPDDAGDGSRAGVPARASPTVVVTVTAEGSAVQLTVEDDGPGIPEDELRGILEGEVSALQHGAGIGLWVVKWCVDLADASLTVETDGWTRVTVTFPSERDLQTSATGLGGGSQ